MYLTNVVGCVRLVATVPNVRGELEAEAVTKIPHVGDGDFDNLG